MAESAPALAAGCDGAGSITPVSDETPPAADAVLCVIGIAMLFMYLVRMVHVDRRCQYLRRFLRRWGGDAGTADVEVGASGGARDRKVEAIEEAVAQGLRAKAEVNMLIAVPYLTAFTVACVCSIVLNILARSNRWMSFEQTVVMFCLCIAFQILTWCPSKILSGRPGVAYTLSMSIPCALVLTSKLDPMSVFLTEMLTVIFRVSLSIGYHRMSLVVLCNLSYFGCTTCVCFSTFGVATVRNVIVAQSFCTLAVLILGASASHAAVADVRREVEALVLRGEMVGLRNLLDLVCDVVVTLDEGLKVTGQCSRFSAWVTLQGQSLEGMRLHDFMPMQEDRDALDRLAHAALSAETLSSDGALPQMLHVKMRDSLGNVIPVELYCVAFQMFFKRGFCVGICEWSDPSPIIESRGLPRSRGSAKAPDGRGVRAPPESSAGGVDGLALTRASPRAAVAVGAEAAPQALAPPPAQVWEVNADEESGLEPTDVRGVDICLFRVLRLSVVPPSSPAASDDFTEASDGGAAEGVIGPLPAPGNQCNCPWHRRVALFQERLAFLGCLPCVPSLRLRYAAQCSRCGFLVDRPGAPMRCLACDVEVAPGTRQRRRARL